MKGSVRFQKGASLWMVLLFIVVLGFGAVFGLKLIPIYLEWWKVERAVENSLQTGSRGASTRDISQAIVRRLDIDEVRRIDNRNINDFMTISKRGDQVTVAIDYYAEESLFGNLSVRAHFEKTLSN